MHNSSIIQPPDLKNRKLIFIRHGQYHRDNQMLTEVGRRQIGHAGNRLHKCYETVSIIWHSYLLRSVQSAAIVSNFYPGVKMSATNVLDEVELKNYKIEVSGY